MKISLSHIAFVFCFTLSLSAEGQNVEDLLGLSSDDAGFRKHELNFGSRFHTNGYSAFLEKGSWFHIFVDSSLSSLYYVCTYVYEYAHIAYAHNK